MGLALLIVVHEGARAPHRGSARSNDAARFWIRIFGINFAVGVVTGIPMEFQFGTNWARFSRYAGGVIGQTLAMEGHVRLLPRVELPRRSSSAARSALGPRGHFARRRRALRRELALRLLHRRHQRLHAASGRPRARRRRHASQLDELLGLPAQPVGARAVRAHDGRLGRHGVVRRGRGRRLLRAAGAARRQARSFLRIGVIAGLVAERARRLPDRRPAGQAGRRAPAGGARRDGGPLRERARRADSRSSASPTSHERRLDNPIEVPARAVSFLAYGTFHADVPGLDDFPEDHWPDNIELLYYAFHVMVGLGTLFIALMGLAALLLWRGPA